VTIQYLGGGPIGGDDVVRSLYEGVVYQLSDGDALTVPTMGVGRMAVKLGSGATLRWSPVDTIGAVAHDTNFQADITLQPNVASDIAWPCHRIEAIGGTVRVAFLP